LIEESDMTHSIRNALTLLLLAGSLAGCGGQGFLKDESPDNTLADRFTGLLDERCAIPADAAIDAMQHRELRLLRAEWLLAALTRYGSARIHDYSGDQEADAAMLLTRVNQAIDVVNQARVDVARDPNQFELYRADLIVALLNTANAAIAPTLSMVNGFVIKPNAEDSLNLLGNYFKDRLYAKAYGMTCTEFMKSSVTPAKRQLVRNQVETHLREQCGKLVTLTSLEAKCTSLTGP
jgi:hypothetical protein